MYTYNVLLTFLTICIHTFSSQWVVCLIFGAENSSCC